MLSEHGLKKFVPGFKMGTIFSRSDSDTYQEIKCNKGLRKEH